jgi:hypothetical protein
MMAMQQTLAVINAMEADGVIGRYAIAGAIAAYNYVGAAVTDDLDILISFEREGARAGRITLAPIHAYLQARGYSELRKEGIVIEGWPVQFLPVANALDAEALAQAQEVDIRFSEGGDSVRSRVLRPEHLVATALRVARPKDFIRIAQFLEEKAVDVTLLCDLLRRHDLMGAMRAFCLRTGVINPCGVQEQP